MKIIETIKYTIPTYFIPALINRDYSGLNDTDEIAIIAFEANAKHGLREEYPNAISCHWNVDSNCGSFFTPYHDMGNELDHAPADCTEINLVIFK